MQTIKKLLFLLSSRERKHFGKLLILIIITAILETVGIASILPFMSVLTNPETIETNILLNYMFQKLNMFGVDTHQEFLFVLGLIVFVILVTSLVFTAFTNYLKISFVYMREYTIGKSLLEKYLNQTYSWFLSRHSAEIGKTILSEVNSIITGGLLQLLELISKTILVLVIIILLITVDPKLTLIVGFTLGSIYFLIFYFIRNFLNTIGRDRLKNNELRFKAINDTFSSAKEIKIGNLENVFINNFSRSAYIYAKSISISKLIALFPRYILEMLAFGGMLSIILFKVLQTSTLNFSNFLPIISLYVFAGYRLIPALQQIYDAFVQISFTRPTLDKLYEEFKLSKNNNIKQHQNILTFNKSITLNYIDYYYPNSTKTVLKDINLTIPVKSSVAFIGPTGCGKTTLVDIIIGLLVPQKGTLKVDEEIITYQNTVDWQKSIGYVPQNVFLLDDTIASNIAFGVEHKNINQEKIEKASKIANLHNFVVDELPKKYQTIVGERGVRLSGGQRQRIGIARALYHNPNVLILDEATSALDNQTEKIVMNAVKKLTNKITIIMIAHRLGTVKDCDKIFLLDKGKIIKEGTFDEIISSNEQLQ
jgi:ABC-type multidrug transport system fused ATPase/permease subunit